MSSEKNVYPSITKLQTVCLEQNIPFASYRLPEESEITTLVQQGSFPEKLNLKEQLDQKSGFIIAPFFESAEHATFLLNPDDIFHNDKINPEYIESLSRNTRFNLLEKPTGNDFVTTPSVDFISE